MRLSVAFEGYWLDKQLDFSPHTVAGYNRVFRQLIEAIGDMEIEAVTRGNLSRS